MKNKGKCTKCGSAEVLRVPGAQTMFGHIKLGRTLFSAVRATRYVCARCGFVEDWIDDAADLKRMADKFGKGSR